MYADRLSRLQGAYLPGEIGVRIEGDVLIAAEGAESLMAYPRAMAVLGAPGG